MNRNTVIMLAAAGFVAWNWSSIGPFVTGVIDRLPQAVLHTDPRPTDPPSRRGASEQQHGDDLGEFYRLVIGNLNREWSDMLPSYTKPVLVLYEDTTSIPCSRDGRIDSRRGPVYCPIDHKLYIPTSLSRDVQQLSGCSGNPCRAVRAAAVAHETGHHVQFLLGLGGGGAGVELQADCLSGAVLSHENKRLSGELMEPGDLEAIAKWQFSIGDDVIGGGRRIPAGKAHGTGAQRQQAWQAGWRAGTLAACNAGRAGA